MADSGNRDSRRPRQRPLQRRRQQGGNVGQGIDRELLAELDREEPPFDRGRTRQSRRAGAPRGRQDCPYRCA